MSARSVCLVTLSLTLTYPRPDLDASGQPSKDVYHTAVPSSRLYRSFLAPPTSTRHALSSCRIPRRQRRTPPTTSPSRMTPQPPRNLPWRTTTRVVTLRRRWETMRGTGTGQQAVTAWQSQMINQVGATSGFEMCLCFDPSTFWCRGFQTKTRLESKNTAV